MQVHLSWERTFKSANHCTSNYLHDWRLHCTLDFSLRLQHLLAGRWNCCHPCKLSYITKVTLTLFLASFLPQRSWTTSKLLNINIWSHHLANFQANQFANNFISQRPTKKLHVILFSCVRKTQQQISYYNKRDVQENSKGKTVKKGVEWNVDERLKSFP